MDHTPEKFLHKLLLLKISLRYQSNRMVPNCVEVSEGDLVTLTCDSNSPVEWIGVHLYNSGKFTCQGTYRPKLRRIRNQKRP